jgi:hypothetical protein
MNKMLLAVTAAVLIGVLLFGMYQTGFFSQTGTKTKTKKA